MFSCAIKKKKSLTDMSFMINTDVPVFLKCKLRVYLKMLCFVKKKMFCVISYRDIVPKTYQTPIWTF